MSSPSPPPAAAPPNPSRKRRRSSDEAATSQQRIGLSIHRVGSDARQLSQSDLQRLFQPRNRNGSEDVAQNRRSTNLTPTTSPSTPSNLFSVLSRLNLQSNPMQLNRSSSVPSTTVRIQTRRPLIQQIASANNSPVQIQSSNSARTDGSPTLRSVSQFLTLENLYRCVSQRNAGSATQQSPLSTSRQGAEIRHLMRRVRRSRSSNANGSSSSRR